jgi:crossover junction endodeoxyribonuclease RuvC
MGYALIKQLGQKIDVIVIGVIEMQHIDDPYEKLQKIFFKVTGLIDEYNPHELAIEAPFFGQNVQSMLKLGRAQGVAIAAALSRKLTVFEYAPRKIKIAITGSGSASKEQVASMLQSILHFGELPRYFDATDALGVAFCHALQSKNPSTQKSEKTANSWKEFLAKNPDRIK